MHTIQSNAVIRTDKTLKKKIKKKSTTNFYLCLYTAESVLTVEHCRWKRVRRNNSQGIYTAGP